VEAEIAPLTRGSIVGNPVKVFKNLESKKKTCISEFSTISDDRAARQRGYLSFHTCDS
jgi:hypothetical protein